VTQKTTSESELGAKLANEEAFTIFEVPADMFDSWSDKLERVLLQSVAQVVDARKDVTDITNVGEDL
jgi:hypothetical protein